MLGLAVQLRPGLPVQTLLGLDRHVLILDRVEDLTALLAFDKLRIIVSGDNTDNRVSAGRGGHGDGSECYGILPPPSRHVNRNLLPSLKKHRVLRHRQRRHTLEIVGVGLLKAGLACFA